MSPADPERSAHSGPGNVLSPELEMFWGLFCSAKQEDFTSTNWDSGKEELDFNKKGDFKWRFQLGDVGDSW